MHSERSLLPFWI